MAPDIWTALIGLGAAAIGAASSLLTTWLGFGRWRAEQRHQRRVEHVDRWRTDLIGHWSWLPNGLPDISVKDTYASLRVHLPEELRRQIEGTDERGQYRVRTAYSRDEGDHTLRLKVMDEIGRIEKMWGLV